MPNIRFQECPDIYILSIKTINSPDVLHCNLLSNVDPQHFL